MTFLQLKQVFNFYFSDYYHSLFRKLGSSTRVTSLKGAPNMADPTSMNYPVSSFKETTDAETNLTSVLSVSGVQMWDVFFSSSFIPVIKLHLYFETYDWNQDVTGLKELIRSFQLFSQLLKFRYFKKARIILMFHVKFHSSKVLRLEDINEKVYGYGN